MRLFVSTYLNKVDRKGRVSVPAPFRTVLAGQESPGIVVYPSFKEAAINCSGLAWVDEIGALIETLPEFSDERQRVSSLFSEMRTLTFDAEGRIMLPDDMIELAGITETAAFVGVGKTFQIWEPEAHKAHQAVMRQLNRDKGLGLPAARAVASIPGGAA